MSTLTRSVAIVTALLLSGCNGSSENSNPAVTSIYGIWRGTAGSSFYGRLTEVHLIAAGTTWYWVELEGRTTAAARVVASGSPQFGEATIATETGRWTLKMPAISHLPADAQNDPYRSPAYGTYDNTTLELDLKVGDELIVGEYTILHDSSTTDRGTLNLQAVDLESISSGPMTLLSGYDPHQFVCGADGGAPLYCYSYLDVNINADGTIAGKYEDLFLYDPRPPSIPNSIPSTRTFTGTLAEMTEYDTLYAVELSLFDGQESYSGVAWREAGSETRLIVFSPSFLSAFRL